MVGKWPDYVSMRPTKPGRIQKKKVQWRTHTFFGWWSVRKKEDARKKDDKFHFLMTGVLLAEVWFKKKPMEGDNRFSVEKQQPMKKKKR